MKRLGWLMLVAGWVLMAQDFSQVEIKTHRITDSIYMLEGAGGNIGVFVGEDGIFMIDDQFAPLTEKIKAAVAEIRTGPVRFIINTHWHFDHTGGNENFGKAGSIIVAHENVRKLLSEDQMIEAFNREVKALSPEGLPVITFTRDIDFHLNEERIHVFHVANAHTNGDAIIHITKGNVVHMGDVFFNGMYPFIDVQHGGNIEGLIKACDRVLGMVDESTRIIPGHGPICGKADLQIYRDMLAAIRDNVKTMLAQGLSLDEVQAGQPTKAYDSKWGGGFINPTNMTRFAYQSLSK